MARHCKQQKQLCKQQKQLLLQLLYMDNRICKNISVYTDNLKKKKRCLYRFQKKINVYCLASLWLIEHIHHTYKTEYFMQSRKESQQILPVV